VGLVQAKHILYHGATSLAFGCFQDGVSLFSQAVLKLLIIFLSLQSVDLQVCTPIPCLYRQSVQYLGLFIYVMSNYL
jgi:hypothetical protein